MTIEGAGQALKEQSRPLPAPGPFQLLLRVGACGVCRTDLHILDGELPMRRPHVVPGHEIVGRVVALGPGVSDFAIGDRVGVPWLAQACGVCKYCQAGAENLCVAAEFTGYSVDGGYADHALADSRFCFAIAAQYSDLEAAPLLCAGLIGYRALRRAGDARRIGIYGFGAAAHIITQVAVFQGREVHAYTRPGDVAGQRFARRLGATWAGDPSMPGPAPLDAAIIFAPVGALVVDALRALDKGGQVICAGIHMSDIPSFAYALLWEERSICSIANLTRADGREFFRIIAGMHLQVESHAYPLVEANRALDDLRAGRFSGAAVLVP